MLNSKSAAAVLSRWCDSDTVPSPCLVTGTRLGQRLMINKREDRQDVSMHSRKTFNPGDGKQRGTCAVSLMLEELEESQ